MLSFVQLAATSLFLATLWPGNVKAQFSAANIAEFQAGNLPYTEPADLTTLYDQFNFSYQYRLLPRLSAP